MNFRKKSKQDDLEINFIPLIDVLLVIIIFLVVSTTFSKFSELKINLPTAEANQVDKKVEKIKEDYVEGYWKQTLLRFIGKVLPEQREVLKALNDILKKI